MTRVAAVDCGTNSLRLLVAEVTGGARPRLVDVERRMEIVRLGQGVDATGRFDPAALGRALDLVGEYAASVRRHGAERVRFVATSATRDAADRDVFVAGVRDRLGVEPEVITGDEEARLSFVGATRGLPGLPEGDVLVVDIGGGSTELVLGDPGTGVPVAARSVDIGCVRLHERHELGGADAGEARAAVLRDVRAALDDAARDVPIGRAAALVGLAGTVTTVTAHALRLPRYDAEAIHGARLPVADLVAACTDLADAPAAVRAALPYLHPGRRDVIGAGALVWREVLQRVAGAAGLTVAVTSEHDILDGLAWSLLGDGRG